MSNDQQLVADKSSGSNSRNPFAEHGRDLATVKTESERAVAEVQAAMVLARRFPRNPVQAMDRILNACARPTLAEGALYSYSRGGTDITGPSIRLAEALAQNWGNLQFGIRELEQRDGESTVEAFAWDIETNTRQVKVFQVRHERHTRQGVKQLSDPRDIYELVANNGARRLRACILGVIPGDVIEEAVRQCDTTLNASADTSKEAVAKIVASFGALGVSKEQIEKRIQRRIESIQAAQIVSLRKIYASIKDAMSKPGDWFDVPENAPAAPVFATETPAAPVEQERETPKSTRSKTPPKATPREALPNLLNGSRVSEKTLLAWLATQGVEAETLEQVSDADIEATVNQWATIVDDLEKEF